MANIIIAILLITVAALRYTSATKKSDCFFSVNALTNRTIPIPNRMPIIRSVEYIAYSSLSEMYGKKAIIGARIKLL